MTENEKEAIRGEFLCWQIFLFREKVEEKNSSGTSSLGNGDYDDEKGLEADFVEGHTREA